MENLQNGDRFYYLCRTQGLNLLNQLERNTFAKLVMRNTDLGDDGSTLTARRLCSPPEHHPRDGQVAGRSARDPTHDDPHPCDALSPSSCVRKDADGDGDRRRHSPTTAATMWCSVAPKADDTIIGGGGNDTVWGDGGDDYLEAGYGVDQVHGGDGDDIIINPGTDIGAPTSCAATTATTSSAAAAASTSVFGSDGQDFIIVGPDGKRGLRRQRQRLHPRRHGRRRPARQRGR